MNNLRFSFRKKSMDPGIDERVHFIQRREIYCFLVVRDWWIPVSMNAFTVFLCRTRSMDPGIDACRRQTHPPPGLPNLLDSKSEKIAEILWNAWKANVSSHGISKMFEIQFRSKLRTTKIQKHPETGPFYVQYSNGIAKPFENQTSGNTE